MRESPATDYRIVHLSDLHLTAGDADSRIEPKLAGGLRGMNAAFRGLVRSEAIQQAGLVFVTGDVTDQGELAAWEYFRSVLNGAGLLSRTLVVPGNHDVCELGARLGSRRKLRQSDLRRARRGLILCGQPVDYPWARRIDDRLVAFGLDTNNSGNLTAVTNAVGRIGFYQLAAFANLLHKHRDVPVKIVAMHHSPNIPRRATALRRGHRPVDLVTRWLHQVPQEDRHCLRLLCLTHRVRLVLHGHLHSAEDRVVSGIRVVGAPATTEPVALQRSGPRPQAAEEHCSGPRPRAAVVRPPQPPEFRFWQYLIRGPGARIERQLLSVRADGT